MLSAAQFDELSIPITNLYSEFEQSILEDIARRIVKTGNPTATAAWQLQRLTESGAVYENAIREISLLTGKSERVLKKTFEQAGVKAIRYDDAIYKSVGLTPLPINLSPQMLGVLQAGLNKTNALITNLTATTALTSQQTYYDAANLIYQQVVTGTMSYDQALRNAITQIGDSGLSVVYPLGHTDKIDVALRRSMLTGIGQTTAQLQIQRADEMDCDLVEVSAHIGARPSHQIWQGQVYSRSGSSKKYKDFVSSTGYGTGEGLGGWNCRHSFYPFFEGLSEQNYSQRQLDEYAGQTVNYKGEKIPVYQATQIQRALERQVRLWKRKMGVMQAAKLDASKEIGKVREYQARLRNLINQTKLRRQYVRERI